MSKNKRTKSTPSTEPHSKAVSKVPSFGPVMAEMSWRIALPFMILSLGGIWLDRRYDTDPVYSLIGLFLAIAVVSVVVYKFVNEHYPGTFGGKK